MQVFAVVGGAVATIHGWFALTTFFPSTGKSAPGLAGMFTIAGIFVMLAALNTTKELSDAPMYMIMGALIGSAIFVAIYAAVHSASPYSHRERRPRKRN